MGLFKLRKKKIGFWAGDENNFQFVDGLIDDLSKKYSVKKYIYHGDVDNLYKEMSTVDVCWFEWGNGPVVPATNKGDKKPIINRIHRYELYSDSPNHVAWENVNKLIFSSPSMIKKFENKFPEIAKKVDYEHIGIGVDTELFAFKEKPITKDILYVGRIHPHKNPALLLQIFAKIVSIDPDYKLTIIGGFSDELYEEYFYDQIKKLNIEKQVHFAGKLTHPEMVKYLQKSDFFLITSIIEGLSQASLEAMSCGVRPVIFNYFGAEYGYPESCLYGTVDEAVEMILSPKISRQECRDIIMQKHTVTELNEKIYELIDKIAK